VSPISRLAINLKYLRLAGDLTQEQLAEIAGMGFKFYQTIEGGRKPQIKLETMQRLAKPFGLEVWQILAPLSYVRRAKFKRPKPKRAAERGPRAKWKGILSRR